MDIKDVTDLKGILEGRIKVCIGIKGAPCQRIRRKNGRLCKECHTIYVRGWRKRGDGKRTQVIDGYDFNQDTYG